MPSRIRQDQRIAPRLQALAEALAEQRARLQASEADITPETTVVLETVGSVGNFISAVKRIEGLEWLGEFEEESISPDDDFFMLNSKDKRTEKTMRGQAYLVLTNQAALNQILSLWKDWKNGHELSYGYKAWEKLFAQLHDIRKWGVQDRLEKTGVLQDWRDRLLHDDEPIYCEVEFWFRSGPELRRRAQAHVANLVAESGGRVVQEVIIEEIAYQVSLVQIPPQLVRRILGDPQRNVELVRCEQIQHFRSSGQMVGIVPGDEILPSDKSTAAPSSLPSGDPVVALLDGLPVQNHEYLRNRLTIDDPDNFDDQYPAKARRHGTAMASLIVHGDLTLGEPPLTRPLYVRPILRPAPGQFTGPGHEVVPEKFLVLDLIHRAVRRLFEAEGQQPAAAPSICVVNLSIGIPAQMFGASLSPLARLLDWLSWEYKVLFVVSAGNHPQDIQLSISTTDANELGPEEFQSEVLRAIASDSRNRRLLSPSEALNAVTVGASHSDDSTTTLPPNTVDPYTEQNLPSPVAAHGMGYRRSIKPEILLPGGRLTLHEVSPSPEPEAAYKIVQSILPPGQQVAAPKPSSNNTWHTCGTSNATALASRLASQLYDVLDELSEEPGGEVIGAIPRSVWLKALLTHGATWGSGGEILSSALNTPQTSRKLKEHLSRFIGYGTVNPTRVIECTKHRVTTLSGGTLCDGLVHPHRVPLPPSLSGKQGWRRLVITLAWLTPVNPAHLSWRRAHLWFEPPTKLFNWARNNADWQAVQRGTIQHEVLEGKKSDMFEDGANLEISVSCRADAGVLEVPVPYALATTLEVADELDISLYEEVRERVQEQIRIKSKS